MKAFIAGLLALSLTMTGFGIMPVSASALGDVDGSGTIDATDATRVLLSYAGRTALTDEQAAAADVDGSGTIDATDATLILLYYAGRITDFPAEGNNEETSAEEITEGSTEETTEAVTEAVTYESDIVLSDYASTVNGLLESNGGVDLYNDDNLITIIGEGSYNISGTLTDGQIVVDSPGDVELNLSDVSITNKKGSAIYGLNGDIDISAKKGTFNYLEDGTPEAVDEDGEPDACIYSSDGLKLKGSGQLTITANYSNGVSGKDEVIVQKQTLTITAPNNAIKAKDSLEITSGTLSLTSTEGDGMRCTGGDVTVNGGEIKISAVKNGIYAKKTNVLINDGVIDITSESDGIESAVNTEIAGGKLTVDAADEGIAAAGDIIVTGGTLDISGEDKAINSSAGNIAISGGTITAAAEPSGTADYVNYNYDAIHTKAGTITISGGTVTASSECDGIQAAGALSISGSPVITVLTTGKTDTSDDISAKGIKSDASVTIEGGEITVNSTDDAIHSDGNVTLSGGAYTLTSGDDGVHSDGTLTVSDVDLKIADCYEGLEGESIYINSCTVIIYAQDDSINGAGGNDASSGNSPFEQGTSTGYIEINGGYIYCENTVDGDGIDSNGKLVINGGTIIVNGPTSNGNAAIDYGDSQNDYFAFNGGTIIAAGSSQMAAYPSTGYSAAYSLVYSTSSSGNTNGNNKNPWGSGGMFGQGATSYSSIAAGTLVTVADSDGNVVFAFKPVKTVSNIIFGSADITMGKTYTMYTGGSYSGTLDGCGYGTGGTVSNGKSVASAAVTSKVTTLK